MSLIHTAELAGLNSLEYLTALLRHTKELGEAPGRWLPWNFAAPARESSEPDPAAPA